MNTLLTNVVGRAVTILSAGHLNLTTNKTIPKGNVTVIDKIVCINKMGIRTRLTYLEDESRKGWYKTEVVHQNGEIVNERSTKIEPVEMTFENRVTLLI